MTDLAKLGAYPSNMQNISDEDQISNVAAVAFSSVSKKFGEVEILKQLDLNVQQGEIVTLIGPSGSGKTTVLRLALGLELPSSGTIKILGKSLFLEPESSINEQARRHCGMVFQQFNLFPNMTALQNITLAPRTVLGLRREEADALGFEQLKLVGLVEKSGAYPSQLSGGQQQRVAIARALAMKPRVLLLDEITSALDPEMVSGILDVIRDVAEKTNISMLIVTHEMGFAREVSDRIIVFESGYVVESGSPDQIFNHPSSPRTKAFLQSVINH